MVTVRLEPEDKVMEFPSINTVLQLLNKLGLHQTDALVIRDGCLLTQDLRIAKGDVITIRKVISVG
ncbi:hypothetical protein [Maridesulfovibrio sp.]|uniref:hypothetical protein n=1 Tax=Maridesulfovibrio sp. TaxID=2795000 RepID=UPI002A18D521|nr:hypothetical protein [Maridesulfovibrio sp.]